MSTVGIIIVTHNSSKFLEKCIDALDRQTFAPTAAIVVDSGSQEIDYLKLISSRPHYTLLTRQNIGFCAANNLGWAECRDFDYVLLLNPDAFLSPSFIADAVAFMDKLENQNVGAISGTLLGYDVDLDRPTGLVDSTGIGQSWYGKFRDRDLLAPVSVLSRYTHPEPANSLCGALMFCRNTGLKQVSPSGEMFDPKFFMYKEDIDLSWRLKENGWRVLYHPELWAYHCRGWKSRAHVSKAARVLSAKNELKLFKRHRSKYLLYAIAKYPLVCILGV